MKGRLLLIHWDAAAAELRAGELRAAGWQVEVESRDGAEAYRRVKGHPPDGVIADLDYKASHSRETCRALRRAKALRTLPIVFSGGNEPEREKARESVPDARFASWTEVREALEALLAGAE
jgi:CheY-like chemotaxis protein